jgi:putative methyltransferase (TIGR04325 family)
MNPSAAAVVKSLLPPAFLRVYRKLFVKPSFSSPFATWEEARQASGGYDSSAILEKVTDAALQVKRGDAVFERDSVLFDQIQYSWPLLAGLLWIAARERGRLRLVDFGGSLGTVYFQNRRFLDDLPDVSWNVIEQPQFVERGQQLFQDARLKFHFDVDRCLAAEPCDALLLSGVLPYLQTPYAVLGDLLARGFRYVLIDRTPMLTRGGDRITVQYVPPEVYPASYPAWFFDEEKLMAFFARDHALVEEFDSFEAWDLGDVRSQSKGYVFARRPR